MFHVPNIEVTGRQAEAIGLPIVYRRTKGEKERELEDLKKAVDEAKADFGLGGIVTGAVKSVYQSTRVQRICNRLGLWCFDPLWLKDEIELLNEVVHGGFEVIISGVFAFPLNRDFLGRRLDVDMIRRLERLKQEYGLSPAGEGGELETTVTDAPFFKRRLEILDHDVSYKRLLRRVHDKTCQVDGQMILIVNVCSDGLSYFEFVKPVEDIIRKTRLNSVTKHYLSLNRLDIRQAERVIICGTAMKDFGYLDKMEKFTWITEVDKPVLGLCAGMQILGKLY